MLLAWSDDGLKQLCREGQQLTLVCGGGDQLVEVMLLLSVVQHASTLESVAGLRSVSIEPTGGLLVLRHRDTGLHVRPLNEEGEPQTVLSFTELPYYASTSALVVDDLVVSGRSLRRRQLINGATNA